jgi:hypothetical protein
VSDIIFKAWPKTPRLMKPMVVTEKIDGTNGAVIVRKQPEGKAYDGRYEHLAGYRDGEAYFVGAQSRNRLLPMGPLGMDDHDWQKRDNAGFGGWVKENAWALAQTLGEGHHYGEWYGHKIARKYGMTGRRFALFNVNRYAYINDPTIDSVPALETVPVLYEGEFSTSAVVQVYNELMRTGSQAVPGFMNPEGVIVFHSASGQVYKYLGEDDLHKWQLQAVAA